ncbi:M15 family metallopeptidase [Ramlibacter albus]|uniref:D-alanyl-D-alanine dipeptidase n=1 Tax=Ramlibacter albus TaxID=2079448 RepID=A0A923MAP7_9BURK|nr:M15 family metallopeptidase [Ramlibacter albus]MBC5765869.1 M15 family metallopeptidase [Ramlibacter albus]
MTHQDIPVAECGEPLVDIAREGGILYGPPPERPETEPDYRWVRRSVYDKLLRVQASLPAGLRLRLYEGLRSLPIQAWLFDEEKRRVAETHPHLTPEQVHERATILVAPPMQNDGKPNIPPHSTGGAVDVEIVDANGRVIDFGMEVKDWVDVASEYCETRHAHLTPEARANRLLLCEAMEREGFANYVREWWHYSYGDRYWAFRRGEPRAIYGPVERPLR